MMQNLARRAPHQGPTQQYTHTAPNAALLIDFDNVTMGIRSDLGKELKSLLNSDVIRGKVAVQRAYADWRRYPQYIVPLAESSIDLIFAPAYGSSKKNATDLRMAIDAIELVFTRPEIGTYILMTGDSDFSSCVLKLKEYGKYVIGVGMRESSSDLLIQNCDEYYSYHALSGLTRTDEVPESKEDPWTLVKRAAQQMVARGDVMRSDRLKQVMLEMDPAFDEKAIGYSKFSRFVQEASTKGLLSLRKSENGQYEIVVEGAEPAAPPAPERAPRPEAEGDGRRRRGGRGRDRDREERKPVQAPAPVEPREPEAAEAEPAPAAVVAEVPGAPEAPEAVGPVRDLDQAYGLLQLALRELSGANGGAVRDGDVKRKMMELSPGFDEGELGFSKFTRFLRQAHDAEAIDLARINGGNYEVSLPTSGKRFAAPAVSAATGAPARKREDRPREKPAATPAPKEAAAPTAKPAEAKQAVREAPRAEPRTAEAKPPETKPAAAPAARQAAPAPGVARPGVGSLLRRGSRPGAAEGPPPILPGQAVGAPAAAAEPVKPMEPAAAPAAEAPAEKAGEPRTRRGRGRKPAAKKATAGTGAETPATEKATPAKPATKRAAKAAKPAAKAPAEKAPAKKRAPRSRAAKAPAFSAEALGLPRDRDSIAAYLSNSYRGIGKKTADTLLDEFGDDVFRAMQEEPDRVRSAVGGRSKSLLEQWTADYERRTADTGSAAPANATAASQAAPEPEVEAKSRAKPKSRRGSRGGQGRKKKEKTAG